MGRGPGWRELALAAGVAVAAVTLLGLAVALLWTLGSAPASVPSIGAGDPPTPTPRAISLARNEAESGVSATQPAAPAAPTAISAAATVAPLAETSESTAAPRSDAPLFAAPEATGFDTLASGAWTANADSLANDGSNAIAEPWLTLVALPATTFAVEAEIRVTGLLDTVCDQSFGLVAGNQTGGQMYGAGVLFPCGEAASRARLTDVTTWEDGYNADPSFADEPFAPGDDWRTYRFELRGDRLRLVVDGDELLEASPPTLLDSGNAKGEIGIWTQGVGIEVRRVTVYPLP